jgi:hypothetical protein
VGWVVCPEADIGVPEANRNAIAPATADGAIEARISKDKRIKVLSRVVEP